MLSDNTSDVTLYIMKIQVDPTKRGKPNGGEVTRLNTKNTVKSPISGIQEPMRKRVQIKRRRENEDAGVASRRFPQTRGSRPAFKQGHEKNVDASMNSASR